MSSRTVEITTTPDTVGIRDEAASGPDCRLRAALLRWDSRGGRAPVAALVGAAWEGSDGNVYWGWPDTAGQIHLRPGPDRPEVCSLLPPALSLALAFHRSSAELGARADVIGSGFLSRLAVAVALAVGCRVRVMAGRNEETAPGSTRPDVVIETTGEPLELDRATNHCRDWGTIISIGGALTSGPFDYYAHVHRRALNVVQVPDRPVLCPGDEKIAERSATRLAAALHGLSPARDEQLNARILPEGTPARVMREQSGWAFLLVEGR